MQNTINMRNMRKILIFGAEGQLGRAFLACIDPEFSSIGVSRADADITDMNAVKRAIESAAPDIVVNCAAYNAVEAANEHSEIANAVNALGAQSVAQGAAEKNTPLVFISSDYVFDGTDVNGYAEDAVPHPLNAYGVSKAAGEAAVRTVQPSHWIVRTSALFGDRGEGGKGYNFVTKMREVGKSGVARVVADQWTSPTYAKDLAAGILLMIKKSIPFGTYHLVNEGKTTWYGFAEQIFKDADMSVALETISTGQSGTTIERPRYSILRNTKLKALGITLRPWEDALREYSTTLKN